MEDHGRTPSDQVSQGTAYQPTLSWATKPAQSHTHRLRAVTIAPVVSLRARRPCSCDRCPRF